MPKEPQSLCSDDGWDKSVVTGIKKSCISTELPEDCRGRWESFVGETLRETNRRNTVDLVRNAFTHTFHCIGQMNLKLVNVMEIYIRFEWREFSLNPSDAWIIKSQIINTNKIIIILLNMNDLLFLLISAQEYNHSGFFSFKMCFERVNKFVH